MTNEGRGGEAGRGRREDAERAAATLAVWMRDNGDGPADAPPPEPPAVPEWTVSPVADAFAFAPAGGRRSNRLYLVRDGAVVSFAPSETTVGEALASLPDRPHEGAADLDREPPPER